MIKRIESVVEAVDKAYKVNEHTWNFQFLSSITRRDLDEICRPRAAGWRVEDVLLTNVRGLRITYGP